MTFVSTTAALNERESRFVDAILDGATRTEAARLSGYGGTYQSQRVQGSRMMKRPKIIHALQAAREAHDAPLPDVAGKEEVLARLTER